MPGIGGWILITGSFFMGTAGKKIMTPNVCWSCPKPCVLNFNVNVSDYDPACIHYGYQQTSDEGRGQNHAGAPMVATSTKTAKTACSDGVNSTY